MNMRAQDGGAPKWRVSMLSLVWFKRDLRVIDHPALALAAAQGGVLPVYIVEPGLWLQPDASARQWDFVAESLVELRRDLAELGQPLIVREGDAVTVLARLHAKHKVDQILSHVEAGTDWSIARNARVRAWAGDTGVPWVEVSQSGAGPLADPPALTPLFEGTGGVPTARSLKLAEDRCPYRQTGGRAAAELALDRFLSSRAQTYDPAAMPALTAERLSSRLSPYLAWGVVSSRDVAQRVAQEKSARRGQRAWATGLRRFDKCLRRRDPGATALADTHEDDIPDAQRLAAWSAGETGVPFVDACLRYLRATGWLEARARAVVAGFGVHHLRLGAEAVGLHLARSCVDYDPAILRHEMSRLTQGRIIDPITMGRKLDPDGGFTRRWLPELAPVPGDFLHTPWFWPSAREALNGRYPEPLVDPASAARAAKARMVTFARRIPAAPRRAALGQMALDL